MPSRETSVDLEDGASLGQWLVENELVPIIGDAEHNCPTAGRCSLFLISRVCGFPRGAVWNRPRFFLDESS
jgi:hypothetical protein